MAFKNKTISNPVTGYQVKFVQTGNDTDGQLLEMEAAYNGHSKEPAAHYHPFQVEDFTVLSGELTVRIDGALRILEQGDSIQIPANKVHSMWNNSDAKTVVNWKVRPAMNTEHLLETVAGLADEGKTNADGRPNFLQIALMAKEFSNVFRLAKPSIIIQEILFRVLTPFAYLFGYKPTYEKYLD